MDKERIYFNNSKYPTIGVEVELLIINNKNYELHPGAPVILNILKDDEHVKQELLNSIVEINTGICKDTSEVRGDLSTSIRKVDEVAKSQGVVQPKRKKPSTATKKVKAVKKPAQKATRKKEVKPATDGDKVLAIIGRSKKGAGTAAIMQKTGYNQKKIANIIYRLRKQQKIKSVEKGVYTKL